MPATAEAALVFLLVVLPGFIAQGGYRLGRAVPEHAQGLVAVARVIALSTAIAVISWKLGGRALYDHARDGTALTSDEGETYRFAVALLVVPGVLGYVVGQATDVMARKVGNAVDQLPPLPQAPATEKFGKRCKRRFLRSLSTRLLDEGPSTWDRVWRRLRRNEPYAYVLVTTKGGREILGVATSESRVALSPQPRDLYLEQVLRQSDDDGKYYPTAYGLGVYVAGDEIESVEWVSKGGLLATAVSNG
jgi:hypothetical protein